MKQLFSIAVVGMFLMAPSAHAQWPWSTPTPVPGGSPTPSPTPRPCTFFCWPTPTPAATPAPTATPAQNTTSGEPTPVPTTGPVATPAPTAAPTATPGMGWPWGTPAPSTPTPTPTPAPTPVPTPGPVGGGTWIKLPVALQSAHPFVSADCRTTQIYPLSFSGATSIKIIVKRATFSNNSSASLKIIDASNTTVARVPGTSSTASYTYIVPGDHVTVNWSCYNNTLMDFGFEIDEIYASLP